MIWIYKELTSDQVEKLADLNPLMDLEFDGGNYSFQTFCEGFEIRDGIHQEIRKAKFFKVHQTKQGFICDEFGEARALSKAISQNDVDSEIFKKYPNELEYWQNNQAEHCLNRIALPVRAFLEGVKGWKPELADILSLELLEGAGVSISDYLPIMHWHSGEIIYPKDRE